MPSTTLRVNPRLADFPYIIYARSMRSDMTLAHLSQDIFAGKPVARFQAGQNSVAVINVRDVDGTLTPRDKLETHENVDLSSLKKISVEPGDVIMTTRGAIRVAVALPEHSGAIPGANIAVIRLRAGIIPPSVVATYLRHPNVISELLREFAGSNTAGFSIAGLSRLKLTNPDSAMLQMLEKIVEATDRYITASMTAVEARRTLALEIVAQHLGPVEPAEHE